MTSSTAALRNHSVLRAHLKTLKVGPYCEMTTPNQPREDVLNCIFCLLYFFHIFCAKTRLQTSHMCSVEQIMFFTCKHFGHIVF